MSQTRDSDGRRCEKFCGFPATQCIRKAKKEIEGRHLCGIHARQLEVIRRSQDRQRWREEQDELDWDQRRLLMQYLMSAVEDEPLRRDIRLRLVRLDIRGLVAVRMLMDEAVTAEMALIVKKLYGREED